MPCLILLALLGLPRLVIILTFLFSDYFHRAYAIGLWPVLGFFFAPFTTLAYAFAVNSAGGATSPLGLAAIVIAALLDVGAFSGGGRRVIRARDAEGRRNVRVRR